ncbi:MAG: L-threonylcarbamoyladenylate synthase [Candidatus Kapabacteria bacterium]|nr:L-threonylcarbamoyladenylate synthase [Candidatus Kapabacteria bacterium]
MKTIILDEYNYISNLNLSSDFLNKGEVIAFPTETVYGLGCDFFNESAVKKIFELKGRELHKPLTAHISDLKFVDQLAENIPDEFFLLAEKFLPGPLTIILRKNKSVPDVVTEGTNTIGFRFPDNLIALDVIKHFGKPLAATSANLSGQSPAIEIKDIINNFNNKIPLIIDGGLTIHQIASTVIDLSNNKFYILREGAISKSVIETVLKTELLTIK